MKYKSLSRTCFFIVILSFIAIFQSQAATYFVWTNSPSDGPGTNWDTAYHVIQTAVDAATNGDTVMVTNGVYNQGSNNVDGLNSRVAITQEISVIGICGAENTLIVGETNYMVTTTLTGKVMCGYQGWFAAEGDGSERGWVHFGRGKEFRPGHCTIDLWPDMSEMDPDETYRTPFKHKDGKAAYVFSSYNQKTVLRHFRWMQEHGIDGVFLQRFGADLRHPNAYHHRNVVTANVQAGANRYGRTWAMMYDLSGLDAGEIETIVIEDWKRLIDRRKITEDRAYLHHKGKPVVAVWGVGFNDGRSYTLAECEKLVKFLKHDTRYGGNTVMLGVPTHWRSLNRDSVGDETLHRIICQADIVSPWTVGRYDSPQQAKKHAEAVIRPDIEWTKQQKLEYLPVIFPGFSWRNLMKTRGTDAKLDQIPRLNGQFLWSQATAFKEVGAGMLYVAMFDEVDEGTAIFKCTNNPPVGNSTFLTYDGLPSDFYLWLTGRIGEHLRTQSTAPVEIPMRNAQQTGARDGVPAAHDP